MGASNDDVQEYMDMFISQVPVTDNLVTEISSLSDIQQSILNDFKNCLTTQENSDQFMKAVVNAVSLSSQPEIPECTDMFTAALAQMMRTWKQRRREEQLIYDDMLKIIR